MDEPPCERVLCPSQALIEPLQREESRRRQRLAYLEGLMLQWEEVFGGSGVNRHSDDPRLQTPLSLARSLRDQDRLIRDLSTQLAEAREVPSASG